MRGGATTAVDGEGAEPLFDDAFLRKLERLAIVAKRVAALHGRGERHTRRAGAGIEFADHRDYVPGDDLRHLDWNLYGRLERPLVRMFDEDEDLPIYTIVDTSASMGLGDPPKLRLAVEVTAALAYVALANLDRVALYPVTEALGTGIGPVRGKGQIHTLLGLLAAARPEGRTDLGAALTALVERHRRRGLVVVVSDFYDPGGFTMALDRLRYARFEPIAVQITAREEAAPDIRGEVTLVDAETREERVVTVTSAVLAAYRARYAERLEALSRFCRERAIPCFQTTSERPFEDLVLDLFRSGGILA